MRICIIIYLVFTKIRSRDIFLRKPRAIAQLRTRVLVENQVKSKGKIADFFEEKFDSDEIDKECLGEEKCTYEEVLELSKTAKEAGVSWNRLARQCFVDKYDCNAQGTIRCINLWNDRKCICKPGWEGESCETDVNECERLKKSDNFLTICPELSSCVSMG